MSFAVIIPTLNAGQLWRESVRALVCQSIRPDMVLVVDSGSTDDTVEIAEDAGFQVKRIEPQTFDHGGTRRLAVECCKDCDFVVFLTQDAILADAEGLAAILAPFDDSVVAAVCGRQLPRAEAGAIEAHARLFNYPDVSVIRTLQDRMRYGLKTAFISNSFAAYRSRSLLDVGNFPERIIFGEDMYVATRLLLAGHSIAYAANAIVCHSHEYSLLEEIRRYFDMGVFHARCPWIRAALGEAEAEGRRFVLSEWRYLLSRSALLIPYGMLRTVCRYFGFRMGLWEAYLPVGLKRCLAMNERFFGNES